MFFFFFKQKTAYEMRISDWSSDVCSSDLLFLLTDVAGVLDKQKNLLTDLTPPDIAVLRSDGTISGGMIPKLETCVTAVEAGVDAAVILRSEEHTSELQSLMRISYAVFCLKKRHKTSNIYTNIIPNADK